MRTLMYCTCSLRTVELYIYSCPATHYSSYSNSKLGDYKLDGTKLDIIFSDEGARDRTGINV